MKIGLIHFLASFAGLVGCFIWLAVTNADNPSLPGGGKQVTYFPPVYGILGIAAQLFIFLPFHAKPPVVFFNDFKSGFTKDTNKTAYLFITFFPMVVGFFLVSVLFYLVLSN